MYNRLITLGCSLTHQIGWADRVARSLNLTLTNLAISAGSNQIQQRRIQEYILRHGITDTDLVIWQITGTSRKYSRVELTTKWQTVLEKELTDSDEVKRDPKYHFTFTKSNPNLFDSKERLDFLCTSDFADPCTDEEQLLEELLFHLVTVKKYTPYLFVMLGWEQAITNQNRSKFLNLLKSYNIHIIEDTICEWCAKQNLPFDGTLHPSMESYQQYALEVILPKLREVS